MPTDGSETFEPDQSAKIRPLEAGDQTPAFALPDPEWLETALKVNPRPTDVVTRTPAFGASRPLPCVLAKVR
jgi:hypothetical protein